jgi:hypothetical protein
VNHNLNQRVIRNNNLLILNLILRTRLELRNNNRNRE